MKQYTVQLLLPNGTFIRFECQTRSKAAHNLYRDIKAAMEAGGKTISSFTSPDGLITADVKSDLIIGVTIVATPAPNTL